MMRRGRCHSVKQSLRAWEHAGTVLGSAAESAYPARCQYSTNLRMTTRLAGRPPLPLGLDPKKAVETLLRRWSWCSSEEALGRFPAKSKIDGV